MTLPHSHPNVQPTNADKFKPTDEDLLDGIRRLRTQDPTITRSEIKERLKDENWDFTGGHLKRVMAENKIDASPKDVSPAIAPENIKIPGTKDPEADESSAALVLRPATSTDPVTPQHRINLLSERDEALLGSLSDEHRLSYSTHKRKAEELLQQTPTKISKKEIDVGEVTKNHLRIRANFLEHMIQAIGSVKRGLLDALKKQEITFDQWNETSKPFVDSIREYETEQAMLISCGAKIHEDLFDSLQGTILANLSTDIVLNDLYHKVRVAWPGTKRTKHTQFVFNKKGYEFSTAVLEAYKAVRKVPNLSNPEWSISVKFCCVTGQWIIPAIREEHKVAHIVPSSFGERDLQYLFGEPQDNTEMARNGLPMLAAVEDKYDSQEIVFLPKPNSVVPGEWIVRVLNKDLLENRAQKITFRNVDGDLVELNWSDLDGKVLEFPEGVTMRPARRYAYFRYALAIIHAVKEFPNNAVDEMPRGEVWASPARPDGYLRRSMLRLFGMTIGDTELPEALTTEGTTFDNSQTIPGSSQQDNWTTINIVSVMRKWNAERELMEYDDSE